METAFWKEKSGIMALAFFGLALVVRTGRYLTSDLARDAAITGVQSYSILRGEFPLFFLGQKFMGALDSYMAAPIYLLAGPSTLTANLPIVLGINPADNQAGLSPGSAGFIVYLLLNALLLWAIIGMALKALRSVSDREILLPLPFLAAGDPVFATPTTPEDTHQAARVNAANQPAFRMPLGVGFQLLGISFRHTGGIFHSYSVPPGVDRLLDPDGRWKRSNCKEGLRHPGKRDLSGNGGTVNPSPGACAGWWPACAGKPRAAGSAGPALRWCSGS